MHAQVHDTDRHVEIQLRGKFTFEAYAVFMKASDEAVARTPREIRINFSEVEDLDSAGLGMLLILREKAVCVGKEICLTGCRDAVRRVVETANFHRLFPVAPLPAD